MRPGEISTAPESLRNDGVGVSGSASRPLVEELRGVRWRIGLGILPMSSSTYELRRVTADCRRRYARLRRSLLVDPHFRKDDTNSPEVVIDDPLSQNPDSVWGHFFRSAELEKTVDQDLSRLYPEHGSYFQTPMCQSMLRRILLLWCLRHPECGYRQGMHELLAPFLYVLQVDADQLSKVQNRYKDQFTEHFEDLAFPNYESTNDSGLKEFSDSKDDCTDTHKHPSKGSCFDDIDPKVQTIISLSDAYGAEGELGNVLSMKFIEHDAYCMFDALMSGSHGSVSMSDFFSPAPAVGSHTGLPPIIEASSALYHLLSIADSSVHSHLVELGVEPQYFALRWLRVLFGREFPLINLLQIWDEILASDNGISKSNKGIEDTGNTFAILTSPRGAFIAAFGLSMMLHLRSSLLASENATSCLQRLLNFPNILSLKKLIGKAKSLHKFAMEVNTASLVTSSKNSHYRSKSMFVMGHISSPNTISPTTAVSVIPESYWEEKWRFIQKAEELSQKSSGKKVPNNKKRWSDRVQFSLSRTESDPSSLKAKNDFKERSSLVRRNLLADLSTELGLDKDDCINEEFDSATIGNEGTIQDEGYSSNEIPCNDEDNLISATATASRRLDDHGSDSEKSVVEINLKDHNRMDQEDDPCSSGNSVSKDNIFLFSASENASSRCDGHETSSERSSASTNLATDDNSDKSHNATCEEPALEISPQFPITLNAAHLVSEKDKAIEVLSVPKLKDKKPFGKFQWLWRFGQNGAGEEASEKGGPENSKKITEVLDPLTATIVGKPRDDSGKDVINHKETTTLKSLGKSMLQNIQVIEFVFRPDNGCASSLENLAISKIVDQGQLDVVAALRELRKISNLLSEM